MRSGGMATSVTTRTAQMIEVELEKSAHNYHPLPVVLVVSLTIQWIVIEPIGNVCTF